MAAGHWLAESALDAGHRGSVNIHPFQWRAASCRGGPQSSLMFCTNGVLLRMLTRGDGLSDITHVRLNSESS